ELVDIYADVLGDLQGRAFDVERVERLIDHAACADAGGRAAQLDPHVYDDSLVLADAHHVNVEQFHPEVVPLQFAEASGLSLAAGLQVDDADAAFHGFLHLVLGQEDG